MSIEVPFIILFLAVPLFFFWRWLLRKIIKNEKNRKAVTWIMTIFSAPILYALIIVIWIFSITYYPSHDFEKRKWMTDKETRYELSEDLIESEILIGKTKQQVREILGEQNNKYESNNWKYYLGFKPTLFGIDPDILEIEFKNGKAINICQISG
ncbi:outer membrane protein assembly factor BamE [Flavobacterium ajazii]|uniref:outer membrane protein assembly factor BamE n=1 Tax=Flavobacterium ajazii TaxID=2692318 RepID=UPI0013D80F2B|nr:outer membrane protein assembly factor BamE [Flavobacterium ajazii]